MQFHNSGPRKPLPKLVSLFIILIVLSLVVSKYILSFVVIPTSSMEPSISPGDKVLLNRLSYLFEEPAIGDVIAFYHEGKIYIKRIVGCPYQTIQCTNSTVYINGESESLVSKKAFPTDSFAPYTIPAGCYFVLGDNRSNSDDSRYWSYPYVEAGDIIGKVIWNVDQFLIL